MHRQYKTQYSGYRFIRSDKWQKYGVSMMLCFDFAHRYLHTFHKQTIRINCIGNEAFLIIRQRSNYHCDRSAKNPCPVNRKLPRFFFLFLYYYLLIMMFLRSWIMSSLNDARFIRIRPSAYHRTFCFENDRR